VNALLALAASVLWGSSDFGGGLISRRVHPSAAVLISQAIALAGLLALLPFFAVPGGWYLLTAAVAGVVATLSLASFYRAMADAPLSLVAPITARSRPTPSAAVGRIGARYGHCRLVWKAHPHQSNGVDGTSTPFLRASRPAGITTASGAGPSDRPAGRRPGLPRPTAPAKSSARCTPRSPSESWTSEHRTAVGQARARISSCGWSAEVGGRD